MASETDKHWIGFDLGGTKMLAVVFDDRFQMVGRCRKKTNGHEGMLAGLKRINSTIAEALADAGIRPELIAGLGIGCPGPLDLDRGVIRQAPNLGWENVPVRDSIFDAFKFEVAVSNDVDAGVFGEYKFGRAQQARCAVGIFPGTGIGGGCVYEGRLLRGTNATCMEIGHVPLMSDGPLDGAGNTGTLESVASRLAIAAAAAQACYRGQAPALMAAAGTDIAAIRSGQLASAIQSGDIVVEEIVRQAAEHLGMAIVTLVHLLAPDIIVLGGGLVKAMPQLIISTAERVARQRVLPSLREVFTVAEARLGDDATVMGAAALARQAVLERS